MASADEAKTITVSGAGEARARPDRATIALGTEARAATAEEAQRRNNAKINAVVAAARAAGISSESIQTSRVSLWPIYQPDQRPAGAWSGAPRQVIEGYQASAAIRIDVADLDQTGAVIDGALTAGADHVAGIYFSLSDDSSVRAEALRRAVADARRRAEALAEAAGLTISGIEAIREAGPEVPYRSGAPVLMQESAARSDTTPEPGELAVDARITVVFRYSEKEVTP